MQGVAPLSYSSTASDYQLDGTLTNTSATIAAVSGDLTLKSTSLSNDRPTVKFETFITTEETTEGTTTTTVVTRRERIPSPTLRRGRLRSG